MQHVGELLDIPVGRGQKHLDFLHAVDVDYVLGVEPRHVADYRGEVACGDAELVGIGGDVPAFGAVPRYEVDEVFEKLLLPGRIGGVAPYQAGLHSFVEVEEYVLRDVPENLEPETVSFVLAYPFRRAYHRVQFLPVFLRDEPAVGVGVSPEEREEGVAERRCGFQPDFRSHDQKAQREVGAGFPALKVPLVSENQQAAFLQGVGTEVYFAVRRPFLYEEDSEESCLYQIVGKHVDRFVGHCEEFLPA